MRDALTASEYWNWQNRWPDLAQFAEDWATTPRPDWSSADDLIYGWLDSDPDRGLAAICAVAQLTDQPEIIASLAAGPLEDFLGRHGETHIEVIKELSRTQPSFFPVLTGVWQGSMLTLIWRQVEAICIGRR